MYQVKQIFTPELHVERPFFCHHLNSPKGRCVILEKTQYTPDEFNHAQFNFANKILITDSLLGLQYDLPRISHSPLFKARNLHAL